MAQDKTVRLWHVATGREVLKLSLPMRELLGWGVRFSPDGRTLAAYRKDDSGELTRVWTAPTFAEIAVAEGQDYQSLMGDDPAIWLATGKAPAKRNRDAEALDVFARVLRFCADHPEREALRTGVLRSRGELLRRLDRLAEAGADNCAALSLPVRDPQAPATLIDLSRHFNESLDVLRFYFPSRVFLEGLPHGVRALPGTAGVEFDLRGAIRVGDTYPDSVEGIPVGQKCRRLHFLQAGGGPPELEPDNTQVASYVLHYADGSREEIPVLYGRDLRTWVVKSDSADIHGAKVAWTGNHSTHGAIRIFMQTRDNPHPDKELESVDFVSKKTKCVPILFGITIEQEQ
jgi:hypothetical protein